MLNKVQAILLTKLIMEIRPCGQSNKVCAIVLSFYFSSLAKVYVIIR